MPVSELDEPAHIVAGVAVADILGNAFTFTTTLAVFEQRFASVPVTLYVVVIVGDTALLVAVPILLSQT